MKRELKAAKETVIKSPDHLRTPEEDFGAAMASMIGMMASQYRNQVLLSLNKGTIDKFEDAAQAGNYAAATLKLSNRVKRKLLRRFDNKRINQLSKKVLSGVNDSNRKALYSKVENAIGINTKELIATEGLKADTNARYIETSLWAEKLRDDSLTEWTNNTIRQMSEGKSITEILAEFDGMEEKRKNHAHFVARQQVVTFNSLMTKTRAQNIGIQKAIWKTSEDERVRPCHRVRNNKEFDLSEGLYASCDGKTLLPGIDYGCRCDYELIIPAG